MRQPSAGPEGGACKRAGAQGRNRTTDTVIFSHVLYQLSYLGFSLFRRTECEAVRLLTVVVLAVQCVRIGGWAGNAIAFAQPFQQVTILAAARTEGRMLCCRLFPAHRAGLRLRSIRHLQSVRSIRSVRKLKGIAPVFHPGRYCDL